MVSMNKFFRGESLYGDDFNAEQLKKWFEDEYNAYSDKLGDVKEYEYSFHAVDQLCGFKFIGGANLNVLGIGSANGVELKPILDKITKLTILENSEKYKNILIDNNKIYYLRANYDGIITSENNIFDLVVAFSCLHHIANFSFVISEIYRVLKPNGIALVREPIVSMGDWRFPRPGLTKNERGIPLKIFREAINKNKFNVLSETIWNFRPFGKFFFFYKKSIFNNIFLTKIDLILSRLFKFNIHYYPHNIWEKFTPSNIFFVLRK